MYLRIVFGMLSIALLTFILSPVGYGQFPGGKGGGGFNPGGGGFGGGFGGKGGKGNKGGGMNGGGGPNRMSQDPNERFDAMAQGRNYFMITDLSPGMQQILNQYAQDNNVQFSSGQVTRDQYLAFNSFLTQKFQQGGGYGRTGPKNGPGGNSNGDGNAVGGENNLSVETLKQLADIDFKSHDQNGDGKLNTDEMPKALLQDLNRWDRNKDGQIDEEEYRAFFLAERFGGNNRGNNRGNPLDAILEDDLERRPTVLRAGKLPTAGMPEWFMKLDTDADGQVALYEWRAGGLDLDEFEQWDRDNDGFITPEEALKVQAALTGRPNPLLASNTANANGPGFVGMGGDPNNGRMPGGGPPKGPNGKGKQGPGGPGGPGGMKGRGGPGGGGMPPQMNNNGGADAGMPQFNPNGKGGKKGNGGKKGGGGNFGGQP